MCCTGRRNEISKNSALEYASAKKPIEEKIEAGDSGETVSSKVKILTTPIQAVLLNNLAINLILISWQLSEDFLTLIYTQYIDNS